MKRVALITGASSGIGKATALEFVQKGFTTYGAARKVSEMLVYSISLRFRT